jgi:hypothetical protein
MVKMVIMNTTVYFALFFIAAIVFFAIVISWVNRLSRNKETEKLVATFDDFVIKSNLTIDKKQKANGNIIGIDRLNFKVVFFDSKKRIFHLIDLSEISVCLLIKERNEMSGHISRIYLQCLFKSKNISPLNLPFYNAERDSVYRMLRLAKKASYWESSINIYRKAAVLAEKINEE